MSAQTLISVVDTIDRSNAYATCYSNRANLFGPFITFFILFVLYFLRSVYINFRKKKIQ